MTAIKFIRPELLSDDERANDRFVREMRISESVVHPRVVRCLETGLVEDTCYIVMEYCELGSLYDLVDRNGPLPACDLVPLFLDVLDGLAYAHNAEVPSPETTGEPEVAIGLVHRDVKPQNILLCADAAGDRIAKIADFGLAKAYETAGLSGLTASGTPGGTAGYMPREQVFDFKYARPDVDVWSTAAALYYALTATTARNFPEGRDPWLAVCTEPVQPVESRGVEVPRELAEVVNRALAEDPAQVPAYPTAADLRSALADAVPVTGGAR
jgi:serine/threonine protein kinase